MSTLRFSAYFQPQSMSNIHELNRKWQQCWTDRSLQPEIDLLFRLLVKEYSKPDSLSERLRQRYYHNLNHINHVLITIDRFNLELQNPIAVKLAAWFHDFVYDPQASDNEIQSAELAKELLTVLNISATTIDRIQQLILATQGHQIDSDDVDRSIFLDADLAILGTSSAQYQDYARSIRQEYSWVSDAEYQLGRTKVLESFLQRDKIYYTDLLFDELESIARFNMSQEIIFLS
jgi:predicted metal-dependent HD superfamily phosphohydrolase